MATTAFITSSPSPRCASSATACPWKTGSPPDSSAWWTALRSRRYSEDNDGQTRTNTDEHGLFGSLRRGGGHCGLIFATEALNHQNPCKKRNPAADQVRKSRMIEEKSGCKNGRDNSSQTAGALRYADGCTLFVSGSQNGNEPKNRRSREHRTDRQHGEDDEQKHPGDDAASTDKRQRS